MGSVLDRGVGKAANIRWCKARWAGIGPARNVSAKDLGILFIPVSIRLAHLHDTSFSASGGTDGYGSRYKRFPTSGELNSSNCIAGSASA